ncbi:hypothetical protein A2U01_0113973, partial [Trifolium medium]|nr:hypothetical protein [Trifolium medium]
TAGFKTQIRTLFPFGNPSHRDSSSFLGTHLLQPLLSRDRDCTACCTSDGAIGNVADTV